MKLPTFDGKEIVPVRLVPFITGTSWLGPVTLAGILANKLGANGFPFPPDHELIEVPVIDEETGNRVLTTITRAQLLGSRHWDNGYSAYHFAEIGKPVMMRPSEWDPIYREISLLEPVLRKEEERVGVPGCKEPDWRLKTVEILPPGVFLWRDDLDLLWQDHIATFTSNTDCDPPDFRRMNYDAYIRPEIQRLVREGFENLVTVTPSIIEKTDDGEIEGVNSAFSQMPATKQSNLPARKGKMVPKEKRRPEEDFTVVMGRAFDRFLEEGNTAILRPRNTEGFLKALNLLKNEKAKIGKDNRIKTTYADLIKDIKPSSGNQAILMQQERLVLDEVTGKKIRKSEWYTRADVSKKLSELRNPYRDKYPELFSTTPAKQK